MRDPRHADLAKVLELHGLQRQSALHAASEASVAEAAALTSCEAARQDRDGLLDYWSNRLESSAPDPAMMISFVQVLAVREASAREASKKLDDAQAHTKARRVHLAQCEARQRSTFRLGCKLRRRLSRRREERALPLLEQQLAARL